AQASLDLAKNRPIAAGIQYEVGYQSFGTFPTASDAVVDPRISRLPAGKMLFGSLRPAVALDLRDDPARPRSGIFVQASGDYFRAFTVELRLSMAPSLELALFYEAGNLWATPPYRFFKTLVLRDAVGFGLRWLTPIGRVAIDLGFNLNPDALFSEPRFGPY